MDRPPRIEQQIQRDSLENTSIYPLLKERESPVAQGLYDEMQRQTMLYRHEASSLSLSPQGRPVEEWLSRTGNTEAGFIAKLENIFYTKETGNKAEDIQNFSNMREFLQNALVGKDAFLYNNWLNTKIGIMDSEVYLTTPGLDTFTKAALKLRISTLSTILRLTEDLLPPTIPTKYGSLTFAPRTRSMFFQNRQEEARTLEAYMRDQAKTEKNTDDQAKWYEDLPVAA